MAEEDKYDRILGSMPSTSTSTSDDDPLND
jgi:hypothetical protein